MFRTLGDGYSKRAQCQIKKYDTSHKSSSLDSCLFQLAILADSQQKKVGRSLACILFIIKRCQRKSIFPPCRIQWYHNRPATVTISVKRIEQSSIEADLAETLSSSFYCFLRSQIHVKWPHGSRLKSSFLCRFQVIRTLMPRLVLSFCKILCDHTNASMSHVQ